MKKPLSLHVAPPLLLLKSATILYTVSSVAMEFRYQLRMSILALFFVGMALGLYWKPRLGRWPAGIYCGFAAISSLGLVARPGASFALVAQAAISVALGCWLAYALLKSEKVIAFIAAKKASNS
jgi:hypothetical protein